MVLTDENKAILAKMDAAADEARKELLALVASDPEATKKVAGWWAKNYLGAGHKRLGRMLASLGKEPRVPANNLRDLPQTNLRAISGS